MSGIVGQNLGRASGLVKSGGVGADSVTGASIADDAIDSEHYVDGSIDNAFLANNAVDTQEIADNAIGLAQMAGGTDGNIISYDASGDPVAIATGNDGQVLTSTGAGSPPAFEASAGSNNLPAFSAVMNASVTDIASATWTTIVYNRELYDTGSLFNTSDGVFTCDSTNAGKWLFCYTAQDTFGGTGVSDQRYFTFNRYDASEDEWTRIQNSHELTGDYHEQIGASQTVMLDMQNGDKMLVQYYHNSGSANGYLQGGSDWGGYVTNIFGGMRLAQ